MSHLFKTYVVAVFFCLSAVAAPAKDSIFVKNLGGTELEIRPDKIENSNLTFFRTKDGRRFTLPMNSFDESSQTKVNDWFKNGLHLSTKYEISVSSGRTAKDNGQQNFDDTAVNLAPEVIVTMGGLDNTRPCRVSAFFFGRSINNRSAIFLFTNDSREAPSLKKGNEAVIKLKGGNWNYDDDEPLSFHFRV